MPPAHLPSHVASPTAHTPARSESTSLSAPRGGRCRLLMRSAGSLVSRLVMTGWAVVVSPPPRDFAPRRCSFVSGCQMRCGASVTCAPLRRHQVACFPRACPYPAAALLCHLGPLLHFRKSASGCCQPTPAGGPLAADLSNRTRRASRQYPAPPGPTRCRGVPGNQPNAPGPHSARWPAARCAAAAAAGLQPAKHAAGGLEPTPGRCCGLGQHASPLHRTGDWARVPARTVLAGMLVTDPQTRAACGSCMLRYQARQLRWRKRRVAAASSGLVCARPTLLGASFACDFDPRVPDAVQVRRRDAACRKLCQMREFNADISVRSCSLWRLTGG